MGTVKEINAALSEEEIKMLEASKDKPIVFDEDCPEITPEKAVKFRRAHPSKRIVGK